MKLVTVLKHTEDMYWINATHKLHNLYTPIPKHTNTQCLLLNSFLYKILYIIPPTSCQCEVLQIMPFSPSQHVCSQLTLRNGGGGGFGVKFGTGRQSRGAGAGGGGAWAEGCRSDGVLIDSCGGRDSCDAGGRGQQRPRRGYQRGGGAMGRQLGLGSWQERDLLHGRLAVIRGLMVQDSLQMCILLGKRSDGKLRRRQLCLSSNDAIGGGGYCRQGDWYRSSLRIHRRCRKPARCSGGLQDKNIAETCYKCQKYKTTAKICI